MSWLLEFDVNICVTEWQCIMLWYCICITLPVDCDPNLSCPALSPVTPTHSKMKLACDKSSFSSSPGLEPSPPPHHCSDYQDQPGHGMKSRCWSTASLSPVRAEVGSSPRPAPPLPSPPGSPCARTPSPSPAPAPAPPPRPSPTSSSRQTSQHSAPSNPPRHYRGKWANLSWAPVRWPVSHSWEADPALSSPPMVE